MDKGIKKYIQLKVAEYLKQNGFVNSSKEKKYYIKKGDKKNISFLMSIEPRLNERFDSYFIYYFNFFEHYNTYFKINHPNDNLTEIGSSIYFFSNSYYYFNFLFNYFDKRLEIPASYEIKSYADADVFFDCLKKVSEELIFPLYDKINLISDIDDFYNKKVLENNEAYINEYKQYKYQDEWLKGLIAAKLANNPRYADLEKIYESWHISEPMFLRLNALKDYFIKNPTG
jgi:hypothetical protein